MDERVNKRPGWSSNPCSRRHGHRQHRRAWQVTAFSTVQEEANLVKGCEDGIVGFNCEPLYWKTVPEYHQDAGVTWRVWQDVDNYGDDLLIDSFAQYQNAPADSPLTIYGTSYPGLQAFYDACANGTLPLVSWIVGPAELSEHATYQPMDGAWLQQQIVNAVVKSPKYHETALMISYDGKWSLNIFEKGLLD
jgi:phospholipase C